MTKIKDWHLDNYAVAYHDENGIEHWLETHFNESEAIRACDIVNDHESRNRRKSKFYVEFIA